MSISAAFLVKDPPLDRLIALIEVLRPVVTDYVIVVDDRTKVEAAETMAGWDGVTLVPFSWIDDFAAARNAALPHCRGDWILHLDPDELPTSGMIDFLRAVDASEWGDVQWQGSIYLAPRGYLFFTRNYFDGRQGEEWEEHWHCRLFRRAKGVWYKPVHEQVMLDGMTEAQTRGIPQFLPKAPRSAGIIHSRMNDERIDAVYVAIGEKGTSGAAT